jgi:FdhD protein
MVTGLVNSVQVIKVINNQLVDAEDFLVVEEPLEIQLSYFTDNKRSTKTISVTMRSPGNDEELAAGFLFTEGIINNNNQVESVEVLPLRENIVVVTLNENVIPALQKAERNFYTTSSCGVCGKSSIDAIRTVSVYNNEVDDIYLKAAMFYGLQDQLIEQQLIFQSTGGLHAAALFNMEGNLIRVREDVGRHNALDKLVGTALLNDELPLNKLILLLSGRASFELLQKAIMAGIKIVAAVGAPSSLAVQLAKEGGITLIGFLRNERFNIYCGEQRVHL